MFGRSAAFCERDPPPGQRLQQSVYADSTKLSRADGKILAASLHQRISSCAIAGGMMMKGDRSLNESLEKSFFQALRFAPNVLPDFVGVIKVARIEEANASKIAVVVQGHGLEYYRCGPDDGARLGAFLRSR